ncbi:hypothetical protein HPB47_001693 [Ixodes persulcatus]|uniref:Uncharacterized protein n=1 Tax=Ixodes persulcatus TaxID=34615 RepID=A0AC60PPV3_IXOPE|nr:hypothetical protein HPB47_001693 [Ixodes persulcatus]
MCQSRTISFYLKRKLVPREVQGLFGVVEPSWGHARRLCKILKSEYWRQVRLYLDWLRIMVQGGQEDYHAKRCFEDYRRLASQTTEFIWQQTRMQLPPKKKNAAICMDSVTVLGGATLPEEIKDVLNKGPKYSFEPSTSRPELLAMVRRVANSAGEQNRERAIGDGVDCLKESESTP